MRTRLRSMVGIIVLAFAGAVWAGVAVAQTSSGPQQGEVSGYEIVRATFLDGNDTVHGTARCSDGKMVLGGGGRVLHDDQTRYLLSASEPGGPGSWTAVFVRMPKPAEPEPQPQPEEPLLPGIPAAGHDAGDGNAGQDAAAPEETEFEVSAVCASLR